MSRTSASGILFAMKRLSWMIAGVLCASAAAQEPQAQTPVSVGIVMDTSGSMGAKLGPSRQLVSQFMQTANSQDEFFLIEFNNRPVLTSAFTADTAKIESDLALTQPKGRSALWDAISLALTEMRKSRNAHKALLVISDGGDNSSRYTESEVRSIVREAGVPIYVVGLYDGLATRERTVEELTGPARLTGIAEESGGRHFALERREEITAVAAQLGAGMRGLVVP
jgi:VWFA-related protein